MKRVTMADKLRFLRVGPTKNAGLAEMESDYLARIGRFYPASLVTVTPEKNRSKSDAEIRAIETRRLIDAAAGPATLVTVDERGVQWTSPRFAKWLGQEVDGNPHGVTFVTGGDLGLTEEIRTAAGLVLSLSTMTLPHEMARIILLEQVYRACTILRGVKYHK